MLTPIDPPETTLATAAHRLVSASCPAHVVAHCARSYRFAAVRLSWMEGMAVRHVDGYRAADFEADLLHSYGFH